MKAKEILEVCIFINVDPRDFVKRQKNIEKQKD